MKRKMFRRSALIILGLSFMVGLTAAAKGNTGDTDLPTKIIGFDYSSAANTDFREKWDTTSHYIINSSGFDLFVMSKAPGGENTTVHAYAIIPTAERFIYNTVREKGYTECRLNITTATSGTSGRLRGAWSPDSVGNYPVANP